MRTLLILNQLDIPTMLISKYKNTFDNDSLETISIAEFVNNIKLGTWKNEIERISAEQDKAKRNDLKKSLLPLFTISGQFSKRKKEALIAHSGYICLDFDDVEPLVDALKAIQEDKYTFASFLSASRKGIAVIVKINKNKHLESFLGLESYYAEDRKSVV